MTDEQLRALIRTIPDYPRPGIQFRDIATLLLDGAGFAATIERMTAETGAMPDLIAGIEARGFIFGAALAHRLGCGMMLLRKKTSCRAG